MNCPACKVNEAIDGGPCCPECGRTLSIVEAIQDLAELLKVLLQPGLTQDERDEMGLTGPR